MRISVGIETPLMISDELLIASLHQVMRISVGIETPLLKKLYDSPNAAGVGRLSLGGTGGAAANGGKDRGVAHWYH